MADLSFVPTDDLTDELTKRCESIVYAYILKAEDKNEENKGPSIFFNRTGNYSSVLGLFNILRGVENRLLNGFFELPSEKREVEE